MSVVRSIGFKISILIAFTAALGMGTYAHFSHDAPTLSSATPNTLAEARTLIHTRLRVLHTMSDADWQRERSANPNLLATRAEAIAKNEDMLRNLYDITEDDWNKAAQRLEEIRRLTAENQRSHIAKVPTPAGVRNPTGKAELYREDGSLYEPISKAPANLPALNARP